MRGCGTTWIFGLSLLVGCSDDAGEDAAGSSSTAMGTTIVDGGTTSATTSSNDTTGSGAGEGSTSASTGAADSTDDGATDDSSGSSGGGVEGTLEIYWVDTEGGAATLLVTPEGPLMLVDAGNPGDRDPDRIAAVVNDVIGTDTIDVMLVTHYDGDHVGGVPDLAERVTIGEYWDHGDVAPDCGGGCQNNYAAYVAVAGDNRTTIAAGDERDFGGVTLRFVSSNGDLITEPLGDGAPNPACKGATTMPESQNENAMSVGFVASFGAFDFLDLGDLYWFQEDMLVCPNNSIGTVDLYQSTHHGLAASGATQLVHGVTPTVVVMNNGATKGGSVEAIGSVFDAPGMPDLWQLHLAVNNGNMFNTEEDKIANLVDGGADEANWVRATIDGPTGAITLHNARNGHEAQYASQ